MNLSELYGVTATGGGTVPVGGLLPSPMNPINYTFEGAEYLLTGNIKTYSADYAATIALVPYLRVFGNDAKHTGSTTGTNRYFLEYFSGTYMAFGAGANVYYSSTLNGTYTSLALQCSISIKRVAKSGSYLVFPHGTTNTAHRYTSNGTSVTAVAGTFTTHPVARAVVFGNDIWMAASSLNGTAGEFSYCKNANPSNTWTITTASMIMTSVNGMAYGNGIFVAVGASATTSAGKILTTTDPALGWTNRTADSGITFTANEALSDVVFDGTQFVAVGSYRRILTSTDGINWVDRGKTVDFSDSFALATDGAGTIVAYVPNATTENFHISTDHGVTWTTAQPYYGKFAVSIYNTMMFVNGSWLENHFGTYNNYLNLGASLAVDPDYIGEQGVRTYSTGSTSTKIHHVRIK